MIHETSGQALPSSHEVEQQDHDTWVIFDDTGVRKLGDDDENDFTIVEFEDIPVWEELKLSDGNGLLNPLGDENLTEQCMLSATEFYGAFLHKDKQLGDTFNIDNPYADMLALAQRSALLLDLRRNRSIASSVLDLYKEKVFDHFFQQTSLDEFFVSAFAVENILLGVIKGMVHTYEYVELKNVEAMK